ncbi:MAG: hypothetical protein Q6K90_07140 [Gloeomargarita sp. HHBFW_bins_162]
MIQNNGWRFWFGWLLLLLLLSSVGLGGLARILSLFILFLWLTPTLLTLGIRWWLGRTIVTSACPVCGCEFQGVINTQTQCPNCGERLQVTGGKFVRLTPPGIVDVEAVEVPESQN